MRKEGDTFRKLNAFRIYKEQGIGAVEKQYPRLKGFILANSSKPFSELETELLNALEAFKMAGLATA